MSEAEKTQLIRLADMLIIGPVMIYAGAGKKLPSWLADALLIFGIGTIVYNGANFLAKRRSSP